MNTKILLTTVYVLITAIRSFGQNGNRYIQSGFAQEFGQDAFEQGKYAGFINPSPLQNNGQGYGLGWNRGYQGGNVFSPYQKIGYAGHQIDGFNGGFGFGDGGQLLFGVPQPINFAGNNQRLHRM